MSATALTPYSLVVECCSGGRFAQPLRFRSFSAAALWSLHKDRPCYPFFDSKFWCRLGC